MTAVSLFSGIGGIDIAAHAAGFRTVAFVERDRFCRAVLAHHWPGVPQFDDVVTFGSDHATEFVGADLLHGGFPCQDISAAGLGAGLSGARSGLWFAMLDCIGAIRPRFVLAENVGALRTRGIDTVLGGLESAGYAANALVVAAEDMGAPHRRERVFIVGESMAYRNGREPATERGDDGKVRGVPKAQRQPKHGPSVPRRSRADGIVADADSAGREQLRSAEPGGEELASSERGGELADAAGEQGGRRVQRGVPTDASAVGGRRAESRLGREFDGIPAGLDRCTRPAWPARPGEAQYDWESPRLTTKGGRGTNRAARLKALGNAVVPAQVYPILAAMAGRLREEATR